MDPQPGSSTGGRGKLNQSRWLQMHPYPCSTPPSPPATSALLSSLSWLPMALKTKFNTGFPFPSPACRGGKKVCDGLPSRFSLSSLEQVTESL